MTDGYSPWSKFNAHSWSVLNARRHYDIQESVADQVDQRLSTYGYVWDDISTKEDRNYWVAGGRLRVVNLESGEVVAERLGYLIEPRFGVHSGTFNQSPWRAAQKCAIRIPAYSGRREFISTALGTWNELTKGEGK